MPSRICSGCALEKFSRMCEPGSPPGIEGIAGHEGHVLAQRSIEQLHGVDAGRQSDPQEQSALGMRP